MPDKVVPVGEKAGTPVDQCIIGTCTNGSYFDVATVAAVVEDEVVAGETDFVAPASSAPSRCFRPRAAPRNCTPGVNLSEATCGACIGQATSPRRTP